MNIIRGISKRTPSKRAGHRGRVKGWLAWLERAFKIAKCTGARCIRQRDGMDTTMDGGIRGMRERDRDREWKRRGWRERKMEVSKVQEGGCRGELADW